MSRNNLKELGLNIGASADNIKKSYRKLALERHPNKGGSTEVFQRLGAAYERLMAAAATTNAAGGGGASAAAREAKAETEERAMTTEEERAEIAREVVQTETKKFKEEHPVSNKNLETESDNVIKGLKRIIAAAPYDVTKEKIDYFVISVENYVTVKLQGNLEQMEFYEHYIYLYLQNILEDIMLFMESKPIPPSKEYIIHVIKSVCRDFLYSRHIIEEKITMDVAAQQPNYSRATRGGSKMRRCRTVKKTKKITTKYTRIVKK
jgi:hypothetical protein